MKETSIIESPAKIYILSPDDKGKIVNRIYGDLDSVWDYFYAKNQDRQTNWNFYKGEQWTDEELEDIKDQKRYPFVFNEIKHKVDHLVGTQTQTRLDSRILGREKGDDAAANILNLIVKWAEQINDVEYLETEVFTDAIVGAWGGTVVRWVMDDVDRGRPVVEIIPPYELFWDQLGSKKLGLEDCRWQARLQYVTKMDAIEVFPDKKEEVEAASIYSFSSANSKMMTDFDKHIDDILKNRTFQDDGSRDILPLVEYFERVKIYKYTVADEIRGDVQKFNSKKDAMEFYEGVLQAYSEQEVPPDLFNPDGTTRITVQENKVDCIYQTIMFGDRVIYHEATDLPFFPYNINFAYYDKGDFWGFVDDLISPQILVNRFFSQWDYTLGTSPKNMMTVMPQLLHRSFDLEKLREESAKTSPVIPVMAHSAIMQHPNPTVNPELFQGIQFGINRMIDYAGGQNALGFSASAAESGRAVVARAELGGVARLPLFDKLRFWRKNLTLQLIWYIKNFMSPGQMLRIIGDDDEIKFVNVDQSVLDTLQELEVDVIIDEAIKSESIKERQFQQLKELLSVLPGLAPEIAVSIMLEYSILPQSVKEKMQSMMDFYVKYSQERAAMQKQQKMQQEVEDAVEKSKLRDMMERTEQMQEQAKELGKAGKEVQTKLTDIEKAKIQAQEENALPSEKMAMMDKMRTPGELANYGASQIQGSLR